MVHFEFSNAKLLQKGDFGSWIRTDKLKKNLDLDLVEMERISTLRVIFDRSNLDLNHMI